jgi:hypothetical protein
VTGEERLIGGLVWRRKDESDDVFSEVLDVARRRGRRSKRGKGRGARVSFLHAEGKNELILEECRVTRA